MTAGTVARRNRSKVATFGLAPTLHDLALRAANRALLIKVLRGMGVERINEPLSNDDECYGVRIEPVVRGSLTRTGTLAGGPRQ